MNLLTVLLSFLLQHFEKLGIDLTPKSIYMGEEWNVGAINTRMTQIPTIQKNRNIYVSFVTYIIVIIIIIFTLFFYFTLILMLSLL